MPTETPRTPFLEVRSFVAEEAPTEMIRVEDAYAPASPFLSAYEQESGGGAPDPNSSEYVVFLNELYDEDINEALLELAAEASELAAEVTGSRMTFEQEASFLSNREATRVLEEHFAPLIREAEAMFGGLSQSLSERDAVQLTKTEIDHLIEQYHLPEGMEPSFENFLGKLKKLAKKAVSKATDLAKKGISTATKLGLGPILDKLKSLVKPLLQRVLQSAIGKLPQAVQPMARKLAERLPFLREVEEQDDDVAPYQAVSEMAEIQQEFDFQVANVLFATREAELELEVARARRVLAGLPDNSNEELENARARFIADLRHLKEGEDPTPYVEQFVPAILPTLKLGINLIGRKRVVSFLAGLVGKLIQQFVGPKNTPALANALVDAGLRLISLETVPDEGEAAASAVAATIEETVRRVASLPDFVLEDPGLLQGFSVDAFEQAAASNFPRVLPKETYRRRPDLTEGKGVQGTWISMPSGGPKRYKKLSQVFRTRITPHRAAAIETFFREPLSGYFVEQMGVPAGDDIEANVHLYEAVAGTKLADVARLEPSAIGLGTTHSYHRLHPLTPSAAALLLGEPGLGRESSAPTPGYTEPGQRFFYLETAGRSSILHDGGAAQVRRRTRVKLTLDFPRNQILVHLFLGEKRAQELAVKLRQRAHVGSLLAGMARTLERGLRSAIDGDSGRLKLIHGVVLPSQWNTAIRKVSQIAREPVVSKLQEWVTKGLTQIFTQQAESFISATEQPADGVTVLLTFGSVPGLSQLGRLLEGKGSPLSIVKAFSGEPDIRVSVRAG
jgi:hypothetical protein